jgi:hypothetical protein
MNTSVLVGTAKRLKWVWILTLVGLLIIGAIAFMGDDMNQIHIKHVHGLGYSPDGERILIPVHDGLIAYSNGQWTIPEGEKHDYMGFSPVDNGFYSSGHPAPGSDLPNPLGLVKSTDQGITIETLDLAGEMDFHGVAASYNTHTVYVFNTQPNSRMETPGMYYTQDEAKTWKASKLQGLNDRPSSLAVHPTNDAMVALGTEGGVYLSEDYGNNFEKIGDSKAVTSLFFNNQGELLVGTLSGAAELLQLDMKTNSGKEMQMPALENAAIIYISQHPTEKSEVVVVTSTEEGLHNVYLTKDKGETWAQIAKDSKTISEQNGQGGNEK